MAVFSQHALLSLFSFLSVFLSTLHQGAAKAFRGAPPAAPAPSAVSAPSPSSSTGKTALVLSGGGAKGAFEVGVLEALCENEFLRNSWEIITGTSIGAMNAGALAQFNRTEQCTDGVAAMTEFWSSIRKPQDVLQSASVAGRVLDVQCPSVLDMASMAGHFADAGGMCDPSPGYKSYRSKINQTLIQESSTELYVAASSLSTGQTEWFSDQHPDIIDGIFASGALAPAMPPHDVGGKKYVDGGVFHNTPLLQALRAGADRVIVIMLSPHAAPTVDLNTQKKGQVGDAILWWYLDAIQANVFGNTELRTACRDFPNAIIEGIVPNATVGGTLDFEPAKIAAMRSKGYYAAHDTLARNSANDAGNTVGLDDLCSIMNMTRV